MVNIATKKSRQKCLLFLCPHEKTPKPKLRGKVLSQGGF
nr:MAG TPA_asm: hypothetical protein [Caudoviricetes sp.]